MTPLPPLTILNPVAIFTYSTLLWKAVAAFRHSPSALNARPMVEEDITGMYSNSIQHEVE